MALDGVDGAGSSAGSAGNPVSETGGEAIKKVVKFFEFKSEAARDLKKLGQLPMGFCVEMVSRAGEQLQDTPVGEVVQDCAEYFEGNIEHNKKIRAIYCERYPIIGKYIQHIGAPLDYTLHPEAYEGL